ncbi:MAG: hypothetical protein A2079_07950 [Geobacteraceae bacterium GWC2_48_7]|nr:MAG: hypothetical protein A2079_07950 [Geobacteraceae bacterium GWC2_48_7]
MKKIIATMTVCAMAALTISATAFARGPIGGPVAEAYGGCCQNGSVSQDQFKKFRAETLDLRQEMMNKRFEQQRENLKGTPDAAKINALQAEIHAIQTKIQEVRVQSGLPDRGMRDGECGNRGGRGGGKRSCFGK